MNMPSWLIPLLSLLGGFVGAWVGMTYKLARLEAHSEEYAKWKERAHKQLHEHNEDLLIHDIELDSVMRRLDMPRARRQEVRGD